MYPENNPPMNVISISEGTAAGGPPGAALENPGVEGSLGLSSQPGKGGQVYHMVETSEINTYHATPTSGVAKTLIRGWV